MPNKPKGWKERPFLFGNGTHLDDAQDDNQLTEVFNEHVDEIAYGCFYSAVDFDEVDSH